MQDAVFSSLFGALTTEHRLNFIANNLANVNTAAYKQTKLSFKDTFAYYAHDEIREPLAHVRSDPLFPEPKNMVRPRIAVSKIDYSQGSMQYTGDPLDLAITGENAFFRVNTPTGNYLTRSGHFVLDANGTIMTSEGFALQGDGGNLVIPAGTRHVSISRDGQIQADGDVVGQIDLISVDNPQNLEKLGKNLYRNRENVNVAEDNAYATGCSVEQGYMERANVDVVMEMVNMIEVQRQFEAYQKVMQSVDSLDRAANERVGKRQG